MLVCTLIAAIHALLMFPAFITADTGHERSSGTWDIYFSASAALQPTVGHNPAVTTGRTENGAILPRFCLFVGQGFLFSVRISTQEYSS